MNTTKKLTKNSGFTLVELAIVLVIIGLIIGGVLVGQDLIKAATIRATVTDIEKFNAAATTFRGKYNGLPGDLAASKAVEFAFSAAADANAAGTVGLRDGNGILQNGSANQTGLGGETALFWQDLGKAALIGGSYLGIGASATPATAVTPATMNTYLPKAKLRDSAISHVYSAGGRNYFFLGAFTAVATTGIPTSAAAVTPLEGKGIDEKLDDGAPSTGVVVTIAPATGPADPVTVEAAAAAATTVCTATGPIYNVSSASTGAPSNVVCALSVRTSF